MAAGRGRPDDGACGARGERWSATSFFAQQAAEKAMKALLVEREGRPPPRTHDLVALARELRVPKTFTDGLTDLTRAYVVSRYPDVLLKLAPPGGIGREVAERHLRDAEKVMTWVEQQLSTAS